MALISERMESCGKKVLDTAGVVREAMLRQSALSMVKFPLVLGTARWL